MDKALSLRLYDVMEKVGASEYIRKIRQDTMITSELVSTYKNQIDDTCFSFNASSIFVFGSACEGTTTRGLDSDIDCLKCSNSLPVIDDINTGLQGKSLLMIRDDDTYPGYVKLQMTVIRRRPITIRDIAVPKYYKADRVGRICYTHITNYAPKMERHGPAYTDPERPGWIPMDHVAAHRCITIPFFARDWLHRHRPNLWPSRKDLRLMSRLGCFVVGVGHFRSREADIEWRISFSLQERLMMFSFNPTQHKCYIMLKMLKKKVIQPRIGESISSYHCKTCMFYAIENTTAKLWEPNQLLKCLRLCLIILLTWVSEGNCPNYFIPAENMFDRPHYIQIKDQLVLLLRELVIECPLFISRLNCDNIGKLVKDPTLYPNKHENVSVQYLEYDKFIGEINTFSKHVTRYCFNIKDNRDACLHLFRHIERLSSIRVTTGHTEQQSKDAISYVKSVLHIQLAQRIAAFAFSTEHQAHSRQLLRLSCHHILESGQLELKTSRLLIASLLIKLQKYDLCELILENTSKSLNNPVQHVCSCYPKRTMRNEKLYRLLKNNNISKRKFAECYVVHCVRFLPCDSGIIPIPLQAEMFRSENTLPGSRDDYKDVWFDWAVVDGKFYLYFLQYIVYSKLNKPENKRVAINNMAALLGDEYNLTHKETGYNLLGWVYVQEVRQQDAILCFLMSWRIRPHHNAAKFHFQKLARDMRRI